MSYIKNIISGAALFALPFLASAQVEIGAEITGSFDAILAFINTTLIPFIIAIGFLFFVWGMFQYFIAGGANDEAKAKGKSLMIYATLGFVLIIVFWGIINLIGGSLGLNEDLDGGLIPSAPEGR